MNYFYSPPVWSDFKYLKVFGEGLAIQLFLVAEAIGHPYILVVIFDKLIPGIGI